MEYKLTTRSEMDTIELAQNLESEKFPNMVICLNGELGSGKTIFTKGFANALGITETVTSPTFNIIKEYDGELPLYHMDVYRLDSAEDFINLGTEDLLYGKGISIIEWSEKVRSELPKSTITVFLEIQQDGSRTITIHNWPYGEISL